MKSEFNEWEVMSNTNVMNLMTVIQQIDQGNNNEGGINLKPFYQRDYKFTQIDESLLIESLIVGIPIPTIYLASDTTKIPHVLNVIDGQHRLNAIHRFLNDKFSLKGLETLNRLNDKRFTELDHSIQNKLSYQVSLTMQIIHVQDNPELEIEIFTRYNKGTHQLTPQEIRGVVYYSGFSIWLKEYIDGYQKNPKLIEIYNSHKSKKRYKDRKVHLELSIILSIYRYGIVKEFYSSTEYSEKLMKELKELESTQDISSDIHEFEEFMNIMNEFLLKSFVDNDIIYPFSKQIFTNSEIKVNHKCQMSILMIMTNAIAKLYHLNKDILSTPNAQIIELFKTAFINSGFDKVTSSTTHPDLLIEVSDKIFEIVSSEYK